MQSHWSESAYGAFIVQQESKLVRQALAVSAANRVALVCDVALKNVLELKSVQREQAEIFAAKFANAHLCDAESDQNIQTDSIDWLILWHSLEQQADPRALLREVTRVLNDGGRVSIFGFNPIRILSRKFWHWKDKSDGQVQSELFQFRLLDWLGLLNYDVTQINTLISPNLSRFERHRLKCVEQEHVNTFPLVGMVYHFEALQKNIPMTPMRLPKSKDKKRALQLVSPAARGRVGKLIPIKNDNEK